MQQTTIYKGKWWLPNNANDKVSGILTYVPGETITLELIGNFQGFAQDALSLMMRKERKPLPVIYGQASDGSNISLFDCIYSLQRAGKAEFPIAKYFPRSIAIGIHIADVNKKRFFKSIVKIPELSYWLYPKTIEQKYFTENDKVTGVNVQMNKLTESERTAARTSLNNSFTLSLTREAVFDNGGSLFSAKFEQFTSLKIESLNYSSIKEFYEEVIRFEQFLSLSTLKEVLYSELCLYSKDCSEARGNDTFYTPIKIDTILHKAPSEAKIDNSSFLFDYETVKGQYNIALQKWFSRDQQFDAIREHMLESITNKGRFSYINFLIVIQAIEGYGWRYIKSKCQSAVDKRISMGIDTRKNTQLSDIINTLLFEYRDITCINSKININAISDSRNYYSHLTEKQKKDKLDGIELYKLTQDLRMLLLCCVMTYLGFSNSDIEKYTSRSTSFIFHKL